MIRKISKYPQATSPKSAAPVRVVNEEILNLIQDLKDTIEDNSIKALSAYQIGSPYSIIVIKQNDGTFLELLNPLIVSQNGEQISQETTAYFEKLSAKIKRANNISIMYEDINMKEHNLKADGEFSILLQRKIDYTFGSNFLYKLDKEEKKLFESKLEFGSEVAMVGACPTNFKRDYIVKAINFLLISMVLLIVISLFISDEIPIFTYELYIASSIVFLNIVYLVYGQYEAKQYAGCTNCQLGDFLGTIGILLTRTSAILLLSYLIL